MKKGALSWLLDPAQPGVRYLALRDLLELPSDDAELLSAQRKAHSHGPIAAVLAEMDPAGFWAKPGPGYNPKYRSGVWSLIVLAQLGASADLDERIQRACDYMLENNLSAHGQFSTTPAPSGTVDCVQGNLCASLIQMNIRDARLNMAYEYMARSVTGEGIAATTDRNAPLRYYAYKSAPLFVCGVNDHRACAWGAVKVLFALSLIPIERRTPLIRKAIADGVDFLFSVDPVEATYPAPRDGKPNRSWWKFGFPVFYVTDLLQNAEALARLGYGSDPRLRRALDYIEQKRDDEGRWALDYDDTGKTWVDFGAKRAPNPWVTLRALRTLKMAGRWAPRVQ